MYVCLYLKILGLSQRQYKCSYFILKLRHNMKLSKCINLLLIPLIVIGVVKVASTDEEFIEVTKLVMWFNAFKNVVVQQHNKLVSEINTKEIPLSHVCNRPAYSPAATRNMPCDQPGQLRDLRGRCRSYIPSD